MKARRPLPGQDELLRLFEYKPESGELIYKILAPRKRRSTRQSRYRFARIEGESFLAHRVIWKMQTGDEPDVIDHIDCNPSNNKLANLRAASHAENLRNRGAPRNNRSGVKGVSFETQTGMWRATITVDYKSFKLGRFWTVEEAAEARRVASETMHGEFSRAA